MHIYQVHVQRTYIVYIHVCKCNDKYACRQMHIYVHQCRYIKVYMDMCALYVHCICACMHISISAYIHHACIRYMHMHAMHAYEHMH